MDSSVKLEAYSATEIYLAVHDSPAGDNINFSNLLDPVLAPHCSLRSEYRIPGIEGTSRWFRGYIGNYRNPKWSRNGQSIYGGYWNHNESCVSYSGCSYVIDASIVCGFDVSVPYVMSPFALFDGYGTGKWIEGEVLRSKYIWSDVIYAVPESGNTSITPVDTSLTFRVARPAEAMNEYQTLPDNAYFSLYQAATPTGPLIRTYIDPNNKSDLLLHTITAGQINDYNNKAEFSFNLDNLQYNTGQNQTIYWRAIKVKPASENMGSSSFLYPDNIQVNNASLYFTSVAAPGDEIVVYLLCDPLLYLNPMSANFSKMGGSITINVSTSSKNYWIATESQSWLSLANNSSVGNGQFIINVDQQVTGNNERSAYVCVNSSAAQVCVTITQDASIPIRIYRLYDGPEQFEYSGMWAHNEYGTLYEVSFGFDSSRNNVYYDASIISIPNWITIDNPKSSTDFTVGNSIKPYPYNSNTGDIMRPYPNSENTAETPRQGYIVLRNDYGGYEEWSVIQNGVPGAPKPVTDFTVDVSFIRTGWPSASRTLNGDYSYITMYPVWKYVLKITNVSTNTIYFDSEATIRVMASTQYDVIDYNFLNYTHENLPSSILSGQTWQDTVYYIKNGNSWNSSYHTVSDINTIWSDNYWSVNVYYTSNPPYNDYYIGSKNAIPLREPVMELIPSVWNFGKSGGTKRIDVSTDGNAITNPYITWTATESCTWLSLDYPTGTADGSFNVIATTQVTGGAARSGRVTVSRSLSLPDISVHITQDASIVTFTVPVLATPVLDRYNWESAVITHNVTSDGGATIIDRGLCWNVFSPPTNCQPFGSGTGSVQSTIGPLAGSEMGVTYYVRAYATNSVGTGYSNIISFVVYNLPSLTTLSATNILGTSAQSGGNITTNGGSTITGKGICWNKTGSPSVTNADGSTSDGTGIGVWTATMSPLDMSTRYYVRAYATNAMGIAYGQQETFVTLKTPTIVTSAVSSIAGTTAVSGGESINTYGGTVIRKGICWSTSINPTLANANYSIETSDPGSFVGYLAGLTQGTTYYVRAFVTTNVGTGYGQNVSFTTLSLPTVTTTSPITDITQTTATGGGNVTSAGGGTVTARGVCWNTSTNPTTANSKTTNGSGTGSFTSSLTSLTPGTTYYVRAYATNAAGTAYGSNVSFTTLSITAPSVTTGYIQNITTTSASCGTNTITNDGGSAIIAKGICWGLSSNPTLANSYSVDGTGTGSWISNLTGLSPNTTYYVRAYATNNVAGTGYGANVSFTTNQVASPPTVQTLEPFNIGLNDASVRGNVTWQGSSPITSRGICYSTSEDPDLGDSYITCGTGEGLFYGTITGLTSNTTYHVRAFATNSVGTSYGSDYSFNTDTYATVTSTTTVSSITQTSASSGGNITSDGGATVTSRGVCWSTSQNPTIANSKTTDGSGIGTFTSSITGLTANTTYYVRAYATNAAGTAYGPQISFTTLAVSNFISASPTSLSFDVDGNPITSDTITISSSGSWTRSLINNGYGTTWLTALPSSGGNGGTCEISNVSYNSTGNTRTLYVRFTCNSSTADVLIQQFAT